MTALPGHVLTSVTGLESVTLEELVQHAALLTRVDRKYVLPFSAADAVLVALADIEEVRALEVDQQRSFGYSSLYYDTTDLAGYHLAARGRRRRFKVRRRTYLDSGESFLEVKTRGGRGATVKERTAADGDADLLAADGADFVDEVLHRSGVRQVRGQDLHPVLSTGYRRNTLYLPAIGTRVTIDTDLTWSLPGCDATTLEGIAIVETKSRAGASVADRALWRHGYRPSRISKYGTGLAALRDELPSNKWCAVLRRHFSEPPTRTADGCRPT